MALIKRYDVLIQSLDATKGYTAHCNRCAVFLHQDFGINTEAFQRIFSAFMEGCVYELFIFRGLS